MGRLGVVTGCFRGMPFPDVLEAVASLGCGWVELPVYSHWHGESLEKLLQDRAALEEELERHGVGVMAVGGWTDFVQPIPEATDLQIGKLHHLIDLAADLGCSVVRCLGGTAKPSVPEDRWIPCVIEGLSECMPHAGERGVTVCLENQGMLCNDAESLKRIVGEVASDNLKLTLDPSNFRWRGHPVKIVHQTLRELAPLAGYVHLKNGDGRSGVQERYVATYLDDGEIDMELFVRELRRAQYRGDYGVDYDGGGEARSAMQRNFEYARMLLSE